MIITLAQLNPTIGDFAENKAKILDAGQRAKKMGAQLIVFSEMVVTGYPPQDLLEEESFIREAEKATQEIASAVTDIAILFGTITRAKSKVGRALYNSAVLAQGGRIRSEFHKTLLPTYDVFDEDRYFEPSDGPGLIELFGLRLGITICEDVWTIPTSIVKHPYKRDPIIELSTAGAKILINLSASPWQRGKAAERSKMLSTQAKRAKMPLIYVNQVGGNDSLIFDGRSAVYNEQGELLALGRAFEEELITINLEKAAPLSATVDDLGIGELRKALNLGLCDYAHKTSFSKGIIGLSGGIDSSVVAVLAAEALGPSNVLGVAMPSRFSTPQSLEDAKRLAKNLGIELKTFSIEAPFQACLDLFEEEFAYLETDATEENMQARIRGLILMALSNKYGHLVLTTGNKSELAIGYCTLYGDMAGGLAVISDVPKMQVYELARHMNSKKEIIPPYVLTRPPSAELRANQTDQDTLPPYAILDPILVAAIEEQLPAEEIVARGFDPAVVADVLRRIRKNEYKRRQAPAGLRVTSKAFGIGRRYPIARK